jgi:4-hydroxy-tetrahydrodipicolinate synthase
VVSLNTPFDGAGRVDFRSLERLVEFHLAEGADGFLVPAQAAEVFCLSIDERNDIVRAVRQQTAGRAVVVAGATAPDGLTAMRLGETAVSAGCDGVLSEPPPGMQIEFDSLFPFFNDLAELGAPLLMIQDLDWRGSGIPVDLIVEMYEAIPAFRCLKVEVNPAGPKYTAVLERTGGRLAVAGGWAALQMMEALDRGVSTFMNTALTAFYRDVFDANESGNRAQAVTCFHRLLPVLAFTRQHLDVSIHFHKRLFQHLGVFRTAYVRKDGIPWDDYYQRQCTDLLSYIDDLYSTIEKHHPGVRV